MSQPKQKYRQAAGQRVLYLREEVFQIPQAELAKRARVSEGTISSAENDGWIQRVKLSRIANDGFRVKDVKQIDKNCTKDWIPLDQLREIAKRSSSPDLEP